MKNFTILLALTVLFVFGTTAFAQTYLTQDFEAEFVPNTAPGPNAPTDWVQTRLGTNTSAPGAPGSSGARDWAKQTYNGSAWTSSTLPNSSTPPHNSPTAASASGTGAAWFNDYYAQTAGTQIRRLESPNIDLSLSTNPCISFLYYYSAGSVVLSGMASSDGGSTWNSIGTVPFTGGTGFMMRSFSLPAAYKVATAKVAFQITNSYGNYDVWLDNVSVHEASLSGTKTVGPTGADYASLTAAITDINTQGLAGALTLELKSDYLSLSETFPLNLTFPTSATNTLTIRPQTGATGLSISGTNTTAIFDLNGGSYVTIDGEPGGSGGAKELTISNASPSGATVRFINDATNNTIKYTNLLGAVTSASGGVVFFSTTVGTTGNDNNTIDHCNISGSTTLTNCIFSLGTTTTTAQYNTGITISNNNIFDFYINTASTVAIGVFASSGSSDWTITGNSLYQTATRTHTNTATGFIGISLNNTTGNNFIVTNNYIGGTAPSAGGSAWTQNGTTTHTFIGIRLSVGTTTASSVQGNTIQNIAITTTSTSTINSAISVVTGSVNVGNVTGNTIGRQDATGNIAFTCSAAGQFCGILSGTGTPGVFNFSNNTIGGITIAGAGATKFYGIRIEGTVGTSLTVNNNTIGSATTANSITSGASAYFVGISSTNSGTPLIATNNLIANFQHTSTGTTAYVTGIEALGAIAGHTITGNMIRNVTSASTNLTTNNPAAMQGIVCAVAFASQTISGNTIHDLSNTAPSQGVYINGITLRGGAGANGTISRNLIYNLSVSSTSATAAVQGIYIYDGQWNIVNNMFRLGTDISTSINPIVRGIWENTLSGYTHNIWYNSIFIGGTQGGATVNTACFYRTQASTINVTNNIFWNNRASTGSPGANVGRHYAIYDAQATTANLTSNYNDLFADANGGTVGRSTAADQITFSDWKTANSTFDASSVSGNPGFTSTTDVHIDPTNPNAWNVNGRGIAIASVANDYNGDARSVTTGTPTDIGADEFTPTVDPTAATESAAPAPSTTTTYTSAGRKIAEIAWGAGGTLPSTINMKYFSSVPPPSAGGTNINSYWDAVPGVDGSGYSYDITFYYTQAEIGSIPEGSLRVGKRDTPNPWVLIASIADIVNKRVVTTGGLSNFSNFTLTDNSSPLPIQLAYFRGAEVQNHGVRLEWRTISEINNYGFFVQRKTTNATEWVSLNTNIIPGHGTTNEPHDYTYLDNTVARGNLQYRLEQVDLDGTEHYTEPINVRTVTSVKELAPIEFALKQNYPNPFNPETNIKFSVETTGRATLELFNMLGQKIATLFDEAAEAGQYYRVRLNTTNFASGMYIYRLQSGIKSDLKKMLLVK